MSPTTEQAQTSEDGRKQWQEGGLSLHGSLRPSLCGLSSFTCSAPSPMAKDSDSCQGRTHPRDLASNFLPASCFLYSRPYPGKQVTHSGLWTETLLIREPQADELQGFNAWETPMCMSSHCTPQPPPNSERLLSH